MFPPKRPPLFITTSTEWMPGIAAARNPTTYGSVFACPALEVAWAEENSDIMIIDSNEAEHVCPGYGTLLSAAIPHQQRQLGPYCHLQHLHTRLQWLAQFGCEPSFGLPDLPRVAMLQLDQQSPISGRGLRGHLQTLRHARSIAVKIQQSRSWAGCMERVALAKQRDNLRSIWPVQCNQIAGLHRPHHCVFLPLRT